MRSTCLRGSVVPYYTARDRGKRPERRSLRAFTLIELLVVVSLIVLLIALLLPALGSARNVAREAACASDSKQAINSFTGYAEDNDRRYPDLSQNPSNPSQSVGFLYWSYIEWRDELVDNYGMSRPMFYSPSNPLWNSDDFWTWPGNTHSVFGNFYFGSTLAGSPGFTASLIDQPPAGDSRPVFAKRVGADSYSTLLWVDLNRQFPPGVFISANRMGITHLDDSTLYPSGTHRGHVDGRVEWVEGGDVIEQAVHNGAAYFW